MHYATNMNNRLRNILYVLVAGIAGWCVTSCGTQRRGIAPPRDAREISLDDWLNINGIESPAVPDEAGAVIAEARKWLGTRYQYGGTTRAGVDCSALVMNVYRDGSGIKLPRTAASQRQYSAKIGRKELKPGDLVFFTSRRKGSGVAHVGLYIGDGKIIHASTSRGVIESRLTEKYYAEHYHSAGRILQSVKNHVEPVSEVRQLTPEILAADSLAEIQREMLDAMLDAAIDSIYASDPF